MEQELNSPTISYIKKLIRESDLRSALDKTGILLNRYGSKELEQDYILLSQDYKQLSMDRNRGIIFSDDFHVRENQIIKRLLDVLERIESIDVNKEVDPKVSAKTDQSSTANNKGCLLAFTNRNVKMTLQILLMAVGLILGGRTLMNLLNPSNGHNTNDRHSEQIARLTNSDVELSIDRFLAGKDIEASKVFYSESPSLHTMALLSILKQYPSCQISIIDYQNSKLKEELDKMVREEGIDSSRIIYEEASAFSGVSTYEIKVIR